MSAQQSLFDQVFGCEVAEPRHEAPIWPADLSDLSEERPDPPELVTWKPAKRCACLNGPVVVTRDPDSTRCFRCGRRA